MAERAAATPAGGSGERVAILGGTFDPVHLGHIWIAGEVLGRLEYDRVVFVPASSAPHKDGQPGASAAARVQMLLLATEGLPGLSVDTIETDRGGVSFSITTVRTFIARSDVLGRPGLVIGQDLVAGFDTWREADQLERLVDLIVVRRPGSAAVHFARRHIVLENAELDISSSDIRARIRDGRPYHSLVPPQVARYIEAEALYR